MTEENVHKFCTEADEYAAKIKADIAGLLLDARDKNRRLDAALAGLDAADKTFRAEVAATEKSLAIREKEIAACEKEISARIRVLDKKDLDLQNDRAKLVADQTEFDARVRAYMERFTVTGL